MSDIEARLLKAIRDYPAIEEVPETLFNNALDAIQSLQSENTDFLRALTDRNNECENLQSDNAKLRETIDWASGQFQGIRLYTQDGKIAAACAEGESKLAAHKDNDNE